MISDSPIAYVWVVFWAFALHSIGPLSLTLSTSSIIFPAFATLPWYLRLWVVAESIFYVCTILYRRYYLERPAVHPPRLSKEHRGKLFERCQDSTRDYKGNIEKWFLGNPLAAIKRDNIKEWFRWAFFDSAAFEVEHEDEIDRYVSTLESKLGTKFEPGWADVKCIRLTLDSVGALHRSLTWYMCILVVDILTHAYLKFDRFQWYRSSIVKCLAMLPPRPYALLASKRSPATDTSYWYRPHTSKTGIPIVFLHGIGVGLYPYMELLKEINQGRAREDGDIGIIAVELLSISSRLTSAAPRKTAMCDQLRTILNHHGFEKFVLVSHSFGSVITTHVLKTPDLATRVSSLILIDPVSILLHQPDVVYNFTVRKPKLPSEWLLWYFGSKDIGVAHTLSRAFFWSENILWKEDLAGHRATVYLGGKDAIINASEIRRYLEDAEQPTPQHTLGEKEPNVGEKQSDRNDQLKVVWSESLNHGEGLDSPVWRSCLRERIISEAER